MTGDLARPLSIVDSGRQSKRPTEKALNKAICNGTMTLQEAQHIIATDWFKYYRDNVLKYAWRVYLPPITP